MSASELAARVQELTGGDVCVPAAADPIAAVPGAYVLLIELAQPVRFSRPALGEAVLSGWLAYVGSARGCGGLRARLGRHFRPGKTVRWHVDELTNAAADMVALAIPDGSECALVERLVQSGRFEPAMAGFGSSDCRHCTAHLLRPIPRNG